MAFAYDAMLSSSTPVSEDIYSILQEGPSQGEPLKSYMKSIAVPPASKQAGKPQSRRGRPDPPRKSEEQADELASLGIKVRDFADPKENILPPVRTIYRHPRQVQPSVPRPLRREDTEPDDPGSQSQSQDTARTLERKQTEPALEPRVQSTRDADFLKIKKTKSQQPHLNLDTKLSTDSQEFKAFVATPTIASNDPIQLEVEVTRNIPTSLDTESQRIPPQTFSYSQSSIALSQKTSSPYHHHLSRSTSPLTPLPSPPSRRHSSTLVSKYSRSSIFSQPQASPSKSRSNSDENLNSEFPVPRYDLRKRKAPTASTLTSTRPAKRIRKSAAKSIAYSHQRKNNTEGSPGACASRQSNSTSASRRAVQRRAS